MDIQAPRANLIKIDNKQAHKLWLKIYSYECGYYSTWVNSCTENRRFYYGFQSTDAEKEELKKRGQYEIVMNKIRKAMRGIVGMVAANPPQYKLIPLTNNDYHTAAIGEKIIKWAWANSSGINAMRLFVKNAAVDNVSYFYVYIDQQNMIRFKTLAYNEVIPDPSCTDPLYRDAEMILVRRELSEDYVKQYYGITDKMVKEIQWEWADTNYGGVDKNYTTTFTAFLEHIWSPDRLFVRIYEVYSKEPYMLEDGTRRNRIRKQTVLGFNHVYDEYLDDKITEYPIIPGYVDKAENPYPRGEVHFLKDLQRFINKSYGVTLLNAQLMSNPKVFIRETDIPNADVRKFEQHFAQPGSINVLTAGAETPVIVQGQPLNQAFFTLYQDAKSEMEWNTIPNQLLGMMDSTKGYQPSALLDMKQTVLDSYKDFMSNIELACSQLGKVILQYARAYLPQNKIIRILGDEDLIVNIPQTLNLDDEQSVQAWIQYQKQRGLQDQEIEAQLATYKYSYDEQKAIQYFMNELDFDNYDVTIIPASYTPTYEMAMLRLMLELLQVGSVDPSMPLRYLPVDNKDELIQRYDTIKQLQAQINQLEEQNNELKQLANSMKQRLIDADIQVQSMKGKTRIDSEVKMQRIKNYFDKYNNKLLTREAQIELQNEIQKLLNEVELEIEKAKLRAKEQEPEVLDWTQAYNNNFNLE